MSKSSSYSHLTSHDFEQEMLNRLRFTIKVLPSDCQIYREFWSNSTVLCLNFESCPYWLEIIKEKADLITTELLEWGIFKSIIFREGNQLKGWRHIL